MSFECVLKCAKPCESSDNINQGKWDSLKSIAKNWSGLDKFGHVHTTTSWQDGPGNHYIHQSCYISISSSDKLEKARRCKNKENDFSQCSSLKSQFRMLYVTKSQRDHHQSACVHLWVGLSMTRQSVRGACKVRT